MQLDIVEGQCPTCKTVHPDDILELLELKKIDDFGNETQIRRYAPSYWYKRFCEEINQPIVQAPKPIDLPVIAFKKPGAWKQFVTYLRRNIHIKSADKQYMAASLLITPLLAFILSFFVKSYPIEDGLRQAYTFAENFNIPSFIFMAVVVPLFIGLSISAQEIFKDRKILKREHFLNLSWGSYLNSKIVVLFFLSALQSVFFVLIMYWILEFQGMFLSYFLVFFSLSCLSNLMGLLLSSTVKSIIAIYIIIPLILIPQLLFSGVIIPYDKINYRISSEKYVPLAADLMPSRWGYEALMVNQFTNNRYQKLFFKTNQEISNQTFFINYTLPRLLLEIHDLKKNTLDESTLIQKQQLVYNELVKLENAFGYNLQEYYQLLEVDNVSNADLEQIERMLDHLKGILNNSLSELALRRDSIISNTKNIQLLHDQCNNYKVDEVVRNTISFERILVGEKSFIRKYEPIYQEPESHFGRSQFYSATKQLGHFEFKTLVFNLLVLWFMTLVLYVFLLFRWFDRIKLPRLPILKGKSLRL